MSMTGDMNENGENMRLEPQPGPYVSDPDLAGKPVGRLIDIKEDQADRRWRGNNYGQDS